MVATGLRINGSGEVHRSGRKRAEMMRVFHFAVIAQMALASPGSPSCPTPLREACGQSMVETRCRSPAWCRA